MDRQARVWYSILWPNPATFPQNTACFLFSITMNLTEAGLAAGPGLGLAPVSLAFQV